MGDVVEKISFLTYNQIQNIDLELISARGLKTNVTDYYLSRVSNAANKNGKYYISSKNQLGKIVVGNKIVSTCFDLDKSSIRPIIMLSKKGIPSNNGILKMTDDGLIEVEFGFYPQTFYDFSSLNLSFESLTNERFVYDFDKENKPIFCQVYKYRDERYIKIKVEPFDIELSNGHCYARGNEIYVKVEPIKWIVDMKNQIMISDKLIIPNIPIKMYDKIFKKRCFFLEKFLKMYFSKEIMQGLIEVKYITRKDYTTKYLSTYLERCKKKIDSGYFRNIFSNNNLFNEENQSSNNSNSKKALTERNENATIIQNVNQLYIEIIFNNRKYKLPLDTKIVLKFEQQDDVNIEYVDYTVITKYDSKIAEFNVYNAIRRAYLSLLLNLNMSEELKKYISFYDKYFRYINNESLISIKTIVNELAYIYYREVTSKNLNESLVNCKIENVRLDKGLDEKQYQKIMKK